MSSTRHHARHRDRSRSPRAPVASEYRRRSPPQPSTRHDRPLAGPDHALPRQERLPLGAQHLSRPDLPRFRALFALYLDVQKRIAIEDVDEREVKGRWKSFVKKWNQGELAEGWYDPQTKQKADSRARDTQADKASSPEASDDDEFGPSLPGKRSAGRKRGPGIPSRDDLEYRDELLEDDANAGREQAAQARKLERKQQRERLDELAPRADAGTRERQLEKRREQTAVHATFRAARSPGAEEVPDADLLGDGGGGADGLRAAKEEERKKSERQVRREEIWRAKAEERRRRVEERQVDEDRHVDMLTALARERFG